MRCTIGSSSEIATRSCACSCLPEAAVRSLTADSAVVLAFCGVIRSMNPKETGVEGTKANVLMKRKHSARSVLTKKDMLWRLLLPSGAGVTKHWDDSCGQTGKNSSKPKWQPSPCTHGIYRV